MALTCKECGGTGQVVFTKERGGPVCNTCGGAGTMTPEVVTRNIAAILDHPSIYMGGPSRRSMAMSARITDYLKSIDAI